MYGRENTAKSGVHKALPDFFGDRCLVLRVWVGFLRPYTAYCGVGGGIYAKVVGVKFRKATTLFSLREVR